MPVPNTQVFDWGQVEWIYEPESEDSINEMSIGLYTIQPGKYQRKHIHYGDEQLLYVISGTGRQTIDSLVSEKGPGSVVHIDAGAVHETTNTGGQPLVELVISIPAKYENKMTDKDKTELSAGIPEHPEATIELNDDIRHLHDSFADFMKIPISIFDKDGHSLVEGTGYPALCEARCRIREGIHRCCLYEKQSSVPHPQFSDPTACVCPHGLAVFIMPVLYDGQVIGSIKGGHIDVGALDTSHADEPADSDRTSGSGEPAQFFSKASVKAISIQLKKLNQLIIGHVAAKRAASELDRKNEIIRTITRQETLLQESLKSIQEKILSIQINNHFLFNTLNALASLAVKEKAYSTYDSIISLSKLFRYTMKSDESSVTLRDEVAYLSEYVNLQKLRFGKRLRFLADIPDEIAAVHIPFNSLQPIVENAFVHGFKSKSGPLTVSLIGKRDQDRILLEISDNGEGMDESTAGQLNSSFREIGSASQPINGLGMVCKKFDLLLGKRFTMSVSSNPQRGTFVEIRLDAGQPAGSCPT